MIYLFQYDHPNIGVVETIGPPIKYENPQLRPYSSSTSSTTIQSNGSLRHSTFMTSPGCDSSIGVPDHINDDSLIGGSSLDTIEPPIDHENPQLLPYPSSNDSFVTSPSYGSFVEVPDQIVEVCLPGHDRSL